MDDMKSLRDVLFANPRIAPEGNAIMYEGRWRSFATLRARVASVAAALQREGVRPGDRVAVLLHNQPEFVECYFAITGLGAIMVPLNWRLHAAEHAALLADAEPVLMIAATAYAATFARLRADAPTLRRILVVGDAPGAPDDFASWSSAAASMPDNLGLSRASEAAILYTSGTTSRPKGVVLTHGNYLADFSNCASVVQPDRDGVNLQVSPLYHAACIHTFFHLAHGGATILIEKFEPGEALRLIEQEKATYFFAAPTALYQMMDHPDFIRRDRSSLKAISYGAAGISKTRLEEAARAFGPILLHAYGMTETTSHASLLRSADHAVALGSIGKGLGASQIRVVRDDGAACAPDEIGEIVIRGPNVMKGYWRRPDATAEAIRDGWMHSGDLARVDANGFVFVVDRKKDMVISGGVNIYPAEIESVALHMSDIKDCAVFGIPDAEFGETLMAVVEPQPGHDLKPDDVRAYLKQHLADYKVPRHIEIGHNLPREDSGKIFKRRLRDPYWAKAGRTI